MKNSFVKLFKIIKCHPLICENKVIRRIMNFECDGSLFA
jgi:hypothetical protein